MCLRLRAMAAADPRKMLPDRIAEGIARHARLLQPLGRNISVQAGQKYAAGLGVFDA